MISIYANREDLYKALKQVNKKYGNNITWNREPERLNRNRIRFTLKCKDSKGPGHRLGFSGRRLISACWHVHGDFFEELFKINPQCEIISAGSKITRDYGNWIDKNIGSMMQPLNYSEACEC